MYFTNSSGNPLQSSSIEVFYFFSLILSYFSFFVFAGRPYHGSFPAKK